LFLSVIFEFIILFVDVQNEWLQNMIRKYMYTNQCYLNKHHKIMHEKYETDINI